MYPYIRYKRGKISYCKYHAFLESRGNSMPESVIRKAAGVSFFCVLLDTNLLVYASPGTLNSTSMPFSPAFGTSAIQA
jgi:hypothetical protein